MKTTKDIDGHRMSLFNFDHGAVYVDKMRALMLSREYIVALNNALTKEKAYAVSKEWNGRAGRHMLFTDITDPEIRIKCFENFSETIGLGKMKVEYDVSNKVIMCKVYNCWEVEPGKNKKTCCAMSGMIAGCAETIPGFEHCDVEEIKCASEGYDYCEFRTVKKK